MQSARELDANKFESNTFDIQTLIGLKKIQHEIKNETEPREAAHINSLFNLTEAFIPKELPELQWKEEFVERSITDREKFGIILRVVSEQSGIYIEKIKSARKFKEMVIPRNIVIFLTRWATNLSMKNIGLTIKHGEGLDHSTIYHACTKVKEYIDTKCEEAYPMFIKSIAQLKDEGIKIDLKGKVPSWYQRLINKDEIGMRKILVTG